MLSNMGLVEKTEKTAEYEINNDIFGTKVVCYTVISHCTSENACK
jgi:hypothetical protein